jgi:hypothetical protein
MAQSVFSEFRGKSNHANRIPAHIIRLFQALDLVLFGALKTIKKTIHGDFGNDSVRDQVIKLLQAYEHVSTSFTIRGLSERQDSSQTSDRSRFGSFSMKGSFARTPAFRGSGIGLSKLTNCRRGASRTGSGFLMSISLSSFQMNKQHLVTRFAPGMPLSHDLIAKRPLTF